MAKNAKKIISKINERVDIADKFIDTYRDSWSRYYKLYRSYIDPNKWPTKTKIFNPYIFSSIETQVTRTIAAKPEGHFELLEGTGDPEKTKMAMDKWWNDQDMTTISQSFFKKTLIYGSAMGQVYWDFRTGVKEGKRQVLVDRPSFRILRLEDKLAGFDPEPDRWEDVKWAYSRRYISKQELKDWLQGPEKHTYDTRAIREAIQSFEAGEYDESTYKSERLSVSGAAIVQDDTVKKVELIYLEDYTSGMIYSVIGRKHLVRAVPNPYPFQRSFVFSVDTIIPSEILGMGEVEPVERIQHGINLIQNQRRDNVESVLKHQWLVGTGANVDDDELIDELNGIIHTADINQVKPLVKPNVTQNSYEEEQSLKMDLQNALGVTNFSKGTDEVDANRSGVAIGRLQAAADARIRAKLRVFEVMFFKSLMNKWQRLAAKYQKDDIRVSDGIKDVIIKPQDLSGEMSYWIEAGSTQHIDTIQDRQDFLAYMKELLALADRKAQDPERAEMYDKLAEKLSDKFGIKDWQTFWEPTAKQEQPPQDQITQAQEPQEFLPQVNLDITSNQQPNEAP